MARNMQRVSLSIDPKLWRRVERLAKASKRSRSDVVCGFIRDGLDDAEVFVKAMSNPVLVDAFSKVFASRDVVKSMASVVGEELSDEQLKLFERTMSKLSAAK